MGRFGNYQKVVLGLGAVSGVALYYLNFNKPTKLAHASWTTNHKPSSNWDDNWDHRSPKYLLHPKKLKNVQNGEQNDNEINEKIKSMKPTATRNILLIRHGQYNLEGVTDKQRILTELGRKQANSTAERLKELGLPYTEIIKSTMSRAQETGSIISESLPDVPVENCDLIREGAPVPPEPPIGHWKPEAHQFYQDGARIEAGFREYFHRADLDQKTDSFTVIVCHANVIRYFVCRALQFPPEAWLRLSLNHASITWLSITPSGRVVLRTLGDSGHMPPKLLTSR